MKKAKVVQLVPVVKELKKELKAKQRELATLSDAVLALEGTLAELDGVTLHEDFPVRIIANEQGDETEVFAGCEEVSRYAFIKQTSPETYRVTVFKAEGDADGTVLAEALPQRKALKLAKDWVAHGTRKAKKALQAA